MRITPEQRRFLGPARTRQDWVGREDKAKEIPAREERTSPPPAREPVSPSGVSVPPPEDRHADVDEAQERRPARAAGQSSKFSRALEVQNAALILGGLFLLAITFMLGKKFEYWKYLISMRNAPKLSAAEANRFPNMSAQELVERAIVEERMGNWKEAADRFIAAKYKNLLYPGLLYRAGKLFYDHNNFDSADTLFERAVAFGENVDLANYYRGMIATGRRDYAAAQRFYEAATVVAPFNADYFYSWAEALRRDRRPKEAIARYEQAALRAGESEANVCRFKMRLTQIEAGDISETSMELENKKSAGPLPVDWLMIAAALQIHAGRIDEAVKLVQQARLSDQSLLHGHFAACVGDKFFSDASNNYPEIAEACRLQASP